MSGLLAVRCLSLGAQVQKAPPRMMKGCLDVLLKFHNNDSTTIFDKNTTFALLKIAWLNSLLARTSCQQYSFMVPSGISWTYLDLHSQDTNSLDAWMSGWLIARIAGSQVPRPRYLSPAANILWSRIAGCQVSKPRCLSPAAHSLHFRIAGCQVPTNIDFHNNR